MYTRLNWWYLCINVLSRNEVEQYIYNNKKLLDCSQLLNIECRKNSSDTSYGKVSLFKAECEDADEIISEIVIIGSKCYSLKLLNSNEFKKMKGIDYLKQNIFF